VTNKEKICKYFERIGLQYEDGFEPNLENLKKLHLAHSITVPYENLDILKDVPLSLDLDQLFNKVVINRRGGYCFEVNGLFAWLLRELGYKTTEYLGRYLRGEEAQVPMRRHRVIKVELPEGDYLADIGIGDKAPRFPVLMQPELEQKDYDDIYKFVKDDFFGWMLCDLYEGNWRPFFSFTEENQVDTDFEMPSFWCEKSPNSPFNKVPIFCLKAEKGMYTLIGNTFKDSVSGSEVITKELSEVEMKEYCKKYFELDY